MSCKFLAMILAAPAIVWCQQVPSTFSTRDLFYEGETAPGKPLVLRYSLLLQQRGGAIFQSTGIDRAFHEGDCVAFEVQVSRPGYVYVVQRGSSGQWGVLSPRQSAPLEMNAAVRVPAAGCFRFDGTPGREDLYLIAAEREQPLDQLQRSLQAAATMKTRDLRLETVRKGDRPGERDYATYVTAPDSGRPLIQLLTLVHQ